MALYCLGLRQQVPTNNDNWYQVYTKDFNSDAAITHHTALSCDIYIWGDSAQRKRDPDIIHDLIEGIEQCYTGRTWVKIN